MGGITETGKAPPSSKATWPEAVRIWRRQRMGEREREGAQWQSVKPRRGGEPTRKRAAVQGGADGSAVVWWRHR